MEERVFRRHNYWLHAPHLYLKNQMKNEVTTTTAFGPSLYHFFGFPSSYSAHPVRRGGARPTVGKGGY